MATAAVIVLEIRLLFFHRGDDDRREVGWPLDVGERVDEVDRGGSQTGKRAQIARLHARKIVHDDVRRVVANGLEDATEVVLLGASQDTHGITGSGNLLDPFGMLGAHQKANVGVRHRRGQRVCDREASIHVPHPHRATAVDAEENAGKVKEALGKPEIVDIVHGKRGHLVHEDVADPISQTVGRVQDLAPYHPDGAVFLIEGLELFASSRTLEERLELATRHAPRERAQLLERNDRVEPPVDERVNRFVDLSRGAKGRGRLETDDDVVAGAFLALHESHRVAYDGLTWERLRQAPWVGERALRRRTPRQPARPGRRRSIRRSDRCARSSGS